MAISRNNERTISDKPVAGLNGVSAEECSNYINLINRDPTADNSRSVTHGTFNHFGFESMDNQAQIEGYLRQEHTDDFGNDVNGLVLNEASVGAGVAAQPYREMRRPCNLFKQVKVNRHRANLSDSDALLIGLYESLSAGTNEEIMCRMRGTATTVKSKFKFRELVSYLTHNQELFGEQRSSECFNGDFFHHDADDLITGKDVKNNFFSYSRMSTTPYLSPDVYGDSHANSVSYINTYHKPVYVIDTAKNLVQCIPPRAADYPLEAYDQYKKLPNNSLIRIDSTVFVGLGADINATLVDTEKEGSGTINPYFAPKRTYSLEAEKKEENLYYEQVNSGIEARTLTSVVDLFAGDGNGHTVPNLNHTVYKMDGCFDVVTFDLRIAKNWLDRYRIELAVKNAEEELTNRNTSTFKIAAFNLPEGKSLYYNVNGIVMKIQSVDTNTIDHWSMETTPLAGPSISFMYTDHLGFSHRTNIDYNELIRSEQGFILDPEKHEIPANCYNRPFFIYGTEAEAQLDALATEWHLANVGKMKQVEMDNKYRLKQNQLEAENEHRKAENKHARTIDKQKHNRSVMTEVVDKVVKGLAIVGISSLVGYLASSMASKLTSSVGFGLGAVSVPFTIGAIIGGLGAVSLVSKFEGATSAVSDVVSDVCGYVADKVSDAYDYVCEKASSFTSWVSSGWSNCFG